jgi:hypothetical protein
LSEGTYVASLEERKPLAKYVLFCALVPAGTQQVTAQVPLAKDAHKLRDKAAILRAQPLGNPLQHLAITSVGSAKTQHHPPPHPKIEPTLHLPGPTPIHPKANPLAALPSLIPFSIKPKHTLQLLSGGEDLGVGGGLLWIGRVG